MVGQARSPLVSGDRSKRLTTAWWLVALDVGFLLGAGAVMAAAWGLGGLAGTPELTGRTRPLILLAAVAVFFAFDLMAAWHGRSIPLGVRRQTPKEWRQRFRIDTSGLLWGVDIGSGITTYRMTSAIWLGLISLFLHLIPAPMGLAYAVGLVLSVSAFVTFIGGGTALQPWLPRLLKVRRPIQLLYVASTLLVAAAAVGQIWSGPHG